nr:PREDICTED: uncharacterized protein LOC105672991 [Linepithema humile]
MLFFGVLSILLLTVSAQTVGGNSCSAVIKDTCASKTLTNSENCNAKYGNIDELQEKVQEYINANIQKSFNFLLMSTYFGNFFESRDGLKGLYRKISDKSWQEAIELSKYLAHRGSMIKLTVNPHNQVDDSKYELNEVASLAKALEHQKELADKALNLHDKALHSHRLNDKNTENTIPQRVNDAGLAHYIVEHFVEPLTESIRQLAGYTNDLKRMLAADSYPVSVYLFDEYIKSAL